MKVTFITLKLSARDNGPKRETQACLTLWALTKKASRLPKGYSFKAISIKTLMQPLIKEERKTVEDSPKITSENT